MFKPGDIVKIKSEEELIKEFGKTFRDDVPTMTTNMMNYLNKKAMIIRVYNEGIESDIPDTETDEYFKNTYRLNVATTTWWNPKWLKPISKINLDDKLFEI